MAMMDSPRRGMVTRGSTRDHERVVSAGEIERDRRRPLRRSFAGGQQRVRVAQRRLEADRGRAVGCARSAAGT